VLKIDVELLHRTYRADPEGTAYTGSEVDGEWPPSPARLFAALVAADGTRDRRMHTSGEELIWLENQSPPSIKASSPAQVVSSPLLPRYVVKQQERYVIGFAQEYLGRKAVEIRPGPRISPRSPTITFVWQATPPDEVLRGLQIRAARIGYLGCADTPVRVSLRAGTEAGELGGGAGDDSSRYEPRRDGDLAVGVIEPGYTARLDAHFDRWLEAGPSVRRAHSPGLRRLARYASPGSRPVEEVVRPIVLWFRLDRPVSGRRVMFVTSALRSTLLAKYGDGNGSAPSLLHGHGYEGKGHETVRFLALPNVGSDRSDGRIYGAAVWFPPGAEASVVAACRQALSGEIELRTAAGKWTLRPHGGERRPWSASPNRWTLKEKRWATAFPAVHERSGRRVDLDELGRWCRHAGLPAPVAYRSQRGPLVRGGVDLAPADVNRPGRPKRSYGHFEVVFESEVQGPIAIGAGRQFGLGLLVPTGSGADGR